jgi:hypothetical protein
LVAVSREAASVVGGRPGEPLVELDLNPPMQGGGIECIGDPPLLVGLEQCGRQPQSLEAVPERADLVVVADPRKIVGVGARPRVADDRLGYVFIEELGVSPIARRDVSDNWFAGQPLIRGDAAIPSRNGCHAACSPALVQPVRHHCD